MNGLRRFQRIAVAGGGTSAERTVSLNSQAAVVRALASRDYDVVAFDPAEQPMNWLTEQSIDCVFNVLHGPGGEDGQLQGALDTVGIAYTGCGVRGSALAMDKVVSKLLFRHHGLPTPEWHDLAGDADWPNDPGLGWPLFVKPASQGSSVGMNRVDEPADLAAAITAARAIESRVMIERCLPGPEFTVSVLGRRVLPSIRIETPNRFYDYDAKYEATTTEYICPALSGQAERTLGDLALAAFDALGCDGWGRVDFMTDSDGQPSIIEVNTVPGMTDHSLVPMAGAAVGLDFPSLCEAILDTVPRQRQTAPVMEGTYGR
ncbi:MAG: D-alanine--D-alanine ligase [Pseudomonadota bacterium]